MAQSASFELGAQRLQGASSPVAGRGVDGPRRLVMLLEGNNEPFIGIGVYVVGPGDMPGPGTVASLAGDVDVRPGGVVAIICCAVILVDIGRMAFGAAKIPVLLQPRPMQWVVVPDRFVGIEMKPALTALGLGPLIPGDRQRLQASAGKCDQVLLQWIDAESVFDLEVRHLAVVSVGVDQELPVMAEEARG